MDPTKGLWGALKFSYCLQPGGAVILMGLSWGYLGDVLGITWEYMRNK